MLEIRNLEKSFGNKQVLFGVDLDSSTRAYPWLSWGKMVPGKQLFSTVSCAFWTTAARFARWQSDHPRDLQGNWLFARRAQSHAKTHDF